MDDVPRLQGCQRLIEAGVESTLTPDNRLAAAKVQLGDLNGSRYASLFDPQTCGGLLLAIDSGSVDASLELLANQGFEKSAVIGEVTERQVDPALNVI